MPVWLQIVLACTTVAGPVIGWLGGRRTAAAGAHRDEAEATESLAGIVVQLGQRTDQLQTALWDALQRLALAEGRAAAAEQRAAAAELRAATSETQVSKLRAEIEALRAELARYEAASERSERGA